MGEEKDLFMAALDLEPGPRKAFLDELCGRDQSLGRRVADMVAQYLRADSFFERSFKDEVSAMAAEAANEKERIHCPPEYRTMAVVHASAEETLLLVSPREAPGPLKHLRIFPARADAQHQAGLNRLLGQRYPGVPVLEAWGHEGDRLYTVEEAREGKSLEQWRGSPSETAALIGRLCKILAGLHDRGLVHGSLRPACFTVAPAGLRGLADPALTVGIEMTAAGPRLIVPPYFSPEQVRGSVATAAADVYSMGMIAYEMLGGALPYRLELKAAAPIRKILARGVCDFPGTPWDGWLQQALRVDPALRFPNAAAMAAAFVALPT